MYTSEEYLAFSSHYRDAGKLPIEDIVPSKVTGSELSLISPI